MFNVRPRAMFPWFHVEPPLADKVPGFRMNAEGSVRDTPSEAASGLLGFGTPFGTLTARYADEAHALAQPILELLTPNLELLAQSTSPTGMAGFPEGSWNIPGFNVRPETGNASPALISTGSDAQRQETNWYAAPRPESAAPPYSDAAPTPTPPSAEDWTSVVPPQLPEWLYKVVTMPVPQLSTAVDPRTGRRIVPYEPLIGPGRSYLVTHPTARGSDDSRHFVDGVGPLLDLGSAEAPSGERWPSDTPMWPADLNANLDATTALPDNAEPTLHPPMDEWPYAEAGGAKRGAPWPPVLVPQPMGPTPLPFVRPVANTNFILANASDEQPMPPPQDQPTEVKNPVTPTGLPDRPPEQRTEQALSRSLEDHRRATADQIDELVGTIATYGTRIYEDSILKARDDLARLAERLRNDPTETALSILNSFPQTQVGGRLVGGLAAVLTILANAKRGLTFERSVIDALNAASQAIKINKNTSKIGVDGLARRSVPDILHKGITEIKSGVEINNSPQLVVQVAYCKTFKKPYNLIVSPATKRISQKIINAVHETGGTIQRFDPSTRVFTPF